MNKLPQNIINTIQKEHLSPRPKYLFVLRNITIWLIASLATIAGIFSVSLISYNLSSQDWDIYSHLDESFLGFLISALPYLWIVLMLIMLAIAVFNIEHTKKGYKYPPIVVAAISLAVTLIIGLSVQAFGGGKALDNYLGKQFRNYQTVETQRDSTWNQPSKGLFSGTIISIDGQTLIIKDSSGKERRVDFAQATLRGNLNLTVGNKVKIIGTADGDNITASEVRPWVGNGAGNGRGKHQ